MTGGGGGDRRRWVELPPGSPGLEAEAGELLRRASQAPAPAPESLARVQRRLFWSPRGWRSRSFGRSGGWLRWAVVGAVLLGSGGVVFARFWEDLRAAISAPPRTTPSLRRGRAPASTPAAPVPAAANAPARAPTPAGAAVPATPAPRARAAATPVREGGPRPHPGSPRTARPPAPPPRSIALAPPAWTPRLPPPDPVPPPPPPPADAVPPPAPAPMPGPLAEEAALLGEAVAQLRQERDAPAALATLDRYRRRYPRGALRTDAALVRIEALLQLGRRERALQVVETLAPEAVESSLELRLLRAELRASADCAAALPELDALLARPLPAPLAERALYGRAGCRLRLGDRAGARQDLEAYRARFPGGRFIADVARHLQDGASGAPGAR